MLRGILQIAFGFTLMTATSNVVLAGAEGRGGTEIEKSRILRIKSQIEFLLRNDMEDFFRWLTSDAQRKSIYPNNEVKQLVERLLSEGILNEIVDQNNGSRIEVLTDKPCLHEAVGNPPKYLPGLGSAEGIRGGKICLSAFEAANKNVSWQEIVGAGLHEMTHQALGKAAEDEAYLMESFLNLSYESFTSDLSAVRKSVENTSRTHIVKIGDLKRTDIIKVKIKFNETKVWPNTAWSVALYSPSRRKIRDLVSSASGNEAEFNFSVDELKDMTIAFFGASLHGGSEVKVQLESLSGVLNSQETIYMPAAENEGAGRIEAITFRYIL